MKFTDLDIHPDLKKAVEDAGFVDLTPIQERCYHAAVSGRDIAGISQTGTGKTVAFLLPIVERLITEDLVPPSALIVAPTRELCIQIAEESKRLCKYRPLKVCTVYGGEGYERQEAELAQDPNIIAATPGRLIDYMKQGKIKLSNLSFLVLDEADRMFDMGFIRDIRYIMRKMPSEIQTMLFSATLSYYVIRLAGDFMKDPEEVRVESESVAIDKIDQQLYHLGRDEKRNYLLNLILAEENIRAIVFTNLKTMIPNLVNALRRHGIPATGISSLLEQRKRIKLLKDFKLGKYSVLVATDVASRGLDVDDITHVFNYDLPMDSESYVHRIGRTARAGKSGISISFCSEADYDALPRIHRYLGEKIPVKEIDENYLKPPKGDFVSLGEQDFGPRDREGGRREGGRRGEGGRREGRRGEGGRREGRRGEGGRRDESGRRDEGRRRVPARSEGSRREPRAANEPQLERITSADLAAMAEEGGGTVRDADRAALLERMAQAAGKKNQEQRSGGRRRGRRGGGHGTGSQGERPPRTREGGEAQGRSRRGGGRRRGGESGERRERRSRSGTQKPEKKGLLAKIVSLFKKK